MARSLYKGPFLDIAVWKDVSKKIWSRRSVILPQFVDKTLNIHNGKQFVRLKVHEEMIGHKFGEFALTRKKPKHPTGKSQKK
jgi:small subunit ribosomal protein S19